MSNNVQHDILPLSFIEALTGPDNNEITQIVNTNDMDNIDDTIVTQPTKQISYLHKYFPYIDKNKRSQIKYDDVGLYSISPPKTANIITNYVMKYFTNNNVIITDAMSGIGGNTLSFADSLYYVNAIEYDEHRFYDMISNVSLFNKGNVLCINEDYLDVMRRLKQDIIFMDPPWGGKSYKDSEKMTIDIGSVSLSDICSIIIDEKLCSMLLLKLPLNYDIDSFNTEMKKSMVIEKLPKIMVIIYII